MQKYKNMEWTREKTMTLINEFRKRRELWDMTHDDYRKKDQKQKYLVEVSKALGGISILEIEKKFHTLRTQYHREINRMKRKESYNSKWFGFKQLQFLSSPKACRSKGRIKSEITEDGTVTTKYIISEHVPENSAVSVQSSNSTIPDEFLTIHRKPQASIVYDESGNTAQPTPNVTSRSQELEKLIEETTKDVQYIEDSKPKLTIKEIRTSIENQSYEGTASEMDTEAHAEQLHISEHEPHEQQHQHPHHHHHSQDQQAISADNVNPLAIEIHQQGADGEITYHQTGNTAQATATIHNLPRIIKIQRRDTMAGQEDDYYHHHQQHNQTQQPEQQHIHSLPSATKRIYYSASAQHTATLLAPTTPPSHQSNGNSLPNATQHRNSLVPPAQSPSPSQQQTTRDEFSTYGEYVANEMRNLANREILIALKHKINTALFEASMAELQK